MANEYITPLLVTFGVIASAYLTYLGTTYKFRQTRFKDPQSELFNYYEQMLKNMWEQSRQKDRLIEKLEVSLDKIQQELWDTKNLLADTKIQLSEATRSSENIQKHITSTREALNQNSAS